MAQLKLPSRNSQFPYGQYPPSACTASRCSFLGAGEDKNVNVTLLSLGLPLRSQPSMAVPFAAASVRFRQHPVASSPDGALTSFQAQQEPL